MDASLISEMKAMLDHVGKSVAAISVAFPLIRFDETRKPEYVRLLTEAGRAASEALGYIRHQSRAAQAWA